MFRVWQRRSWLFIYSILIWYDFFMPEMSCSGYNEEISLPLLSSINPSCVKVFQLQFSQQWLSCTRASYKLSLWKTSIVFSEKHAEADFPADWRKQMINALLFLKYKMWTVHEEQCYKGVTFIVQYLKITPLIHLATHHTCCVLIML